MDFLKPHKGRLRFWRKKAAPTWFTDRSDNLGYYICGTFVDHPTFKGKTGYTSLVVCQEGDEIETLNTRYTLEGVEVKVATYKDQPLSI